MRSAVFLIFICTIFSVPVLAQDSLAQKPLSKKDSASSQYKYKSVDSLQRNFHHRTDSLQKGYAGSMNEMHKKINRLNHKKDSLSKLNLSTQSVTHEIDSMQKSQIAKLKELNGKIDKVKTE